ncbi:hypothetical protein ACFFQF_12935 [Haladaptatus pallidirubidus]|uniref:hypothetical protein n=1 Tax=Haladaptatus pallidirubidus TaxID=1008152 RepID=UPI001D111E84|nr:hypothetical protein [Haladaptatus pallidirubidus]
MKQALKPLGVALFLCPAGCNGAAFDTAPTTETDELSTSGQSTGVAMVILGFGSLFRSSSSTSRRR